MEKLIKQILQDYPLARERKWRSSAIWLILTKLHPNMEVIDKSLFLKIYPEIDSIRREIYQCQKDNPELQGKDWKDGRRLKEEKMIEYGYSPSYKKDLKKLETL